MSKGNEQRGLDYLDSWRTHELEGLISALRDSYDTLADKTLRPPAKA